MSKRPRMLPARHKRPPRGPAASQAYRLASEALEFLAKDNLRPMDELFEVLTLIQTGKIARMPVVLVGREFWARAIDFDFLVEEGGIDRDDLALFRLVDGSEHAVQIIHDFHGGRPPE